MKLKNLPVFIQRRLHCTMTFKQTILPVLPVFGHKKSLCKYRGITSNTAKTTTGKKIVKDGVFIIKEIKKPGAALCGLLTANSITLLTPRIIYCKIIIGNSHLADFVL